MSTPRIDGAEQERKIMDHCACGKRKEVSDYVCHECFRAPNRVRPVRESSNPETKRVTVTFCPNNEFDRGARFLAREFNLTPNHSHDRTTLDMSHWTLHMRIRDWLGREWEVVGEDRQYMKLIVPGLE